MKAKFLITIGLMCHLLAYSVVKQTVQVIYTDTVHGRLDTIWIDASVVLINGTEINLAKPDTASYADSSGVAVTALNATNFDAGTQIDNGVLFEDMDTISSHRNLRWINNILYLSNSIGDSSRIAHANNDGLYIQTYDGSTRIGNIDMTNDAGGIRIEAGTVGNEQDITFYTYENGFVRFLTGEDNGDFRLTLEDSIYYLLSSSDSVLRVNPGQIKFFKDLILEQSVQSSSGNFKFYNNFNSVNFIAGDLTGNDTALLIKQDLFGDGSILSNTYALKIYGINTAVGNSFTIWHNDEERLYIHPDSTTLEYDAGDNYLNVGDEYVNIGVAGEGDKFKVTPDTTYIFNKLKVTPDTTYTQVIISDKSYVKNITHAFFACEDSARDVTIGVQNDWYHVTNPGNDFLIDIESQGFTLTNDTMIYSEDSLSGLQPHIKFEFGIEGSGTLNDDYEFRIYNASQSKGLLKKAESSGDGASNGAHANSIAYDNAVIYGDRYVLQVRNTSNANDFTFENVGIFISVTHY